MPEAGGNVQACGGDPGTDAMEAMMRFLSLQQMRQLRPAATAAFAAPVPTQIVSSDEYLPAPQTAQQREVEARLKELGSALARKQGVSRRRFFETAAGMAASYYVMNQVYGPVFAASAAEAATPELAEAQAQAAKGQLVFDVHTHFLRDDPGPDLGDPARVGGAMWLRALAARFPWNKDIFGKEQTVHDLQFGNFVKEIFLDSDTKVALLSNAPSDDPKDWLLPQERVFAARDQVNKEAGSKRLLAHFTITPGQPGWLDDWPCRQTTVASANASPRRDISAACSRISKPSIGPTVSRPRAQVAPRTRRGDTSALPIRGRAAAACRCCGRRCRRGRP